MRPSELKKRTKTIAVQVLRLVKMLPDDACGQAIATPLARSGSSVGAAYRMGSRSSSSFDFVARLAVAEDAAEEAAYWLELALEIGALPVEETCPVLQEMTQLRRIFTQSRKIAERQQRREFRSGQALDDDLPY